MRAGCRIWNKQNPHNSPEFVDRIDSFYLINDVSMPMDHMNSFQFDLSSRVWNVIFVIRRHVCEVCAKASFVSECEKWKETQRSLWTCVCAQVGDVSLAQWKWKGLTTLRHFEWMRLRMANDKYSGIYELCDDATTILWWNDKIHPCRQSSAAVHKYVVINFAGIEKRKTFNREHMNVCDSFWLPRIHSFVYWHCANETSKLVDDDRTHVSCPSLHTVECANVLQSIMWINYSNSFFSVIIAWQCRLRNQCSGDVLR